MHLRAPSIPGLFFSLAFSALLALPVAAETPHPASCEVELFGDAKLKAAVPPAQKLYSYVAVGDCLKKDAQILDRSPLRPGEKIVTEVYAAWGADLTVCVAAEEEAGKPSTLYGKAKRVYHAEGVGEVVYNGVVVEVKAGAPHVFPPVRAAAKAAQAPASKPKL